MWILFRHPRAFSVYKVCRMSQTLQQRPVVCALCPADALSLKHGYTRQSGHHQTHRQPPFSTPVAQTDRRHRRCPNGQVRAQRSANKPEVLLHFREDLECPSPEGSRNDNQDPSPDPACNAQALKQYLIEVFKVRDLRGLFDGPAFHLPWQMSLNFLQVVGIAFAINVNWTSALLTLFSVSGNP